MNVTHGLKTKMIAGEKVFGALVGPGNDPETVTRTLKGFGLDFMLVETEHSLVDKETIFEYVRASRRFELPLLMRPEENFANFRCYLDAGVNGLMLPQIDTVEQVVSAVRKTYFPPIGQRGCGLGGGKYLVDGQDVTTLPLLEILEYVNKNTVLFPMTESLACVNSLGRILSVEGVTGTIVGTLDLALSIGGIDPKAPRIRVVMGEAVQSRLETILRICRESGKVAGLGGLPIENLARWANHGYQLLLVGYVMDGNVDSVGGSIEQLKSLLV